MRVLISVFVAILSTICAWMRTTRTTRRWTSTGQQSSMLLLGIKDLSLTYMRENYPLLRSGSFFVFDELEGQVDWFGDLGDFGLINRCFEYCYKRGVMGEVWVLLCEWIKRIVLRVFSNYSRFSFRIHECYGLQLFFARFGPKIVTPGFRWNRQITSPVFSRRYYGFQLFFARFGPKIVTPGFRWNRQITSPVFSQQNKILRKTKFSAEQNSQQNKILRKSKFSENQNSQKTKILRKPKFSENQNSQKTKILSRVFSNYSRFSFRIHEWLETWIWIQLRGNSHFCRLDTIVWLSSKYLLRPDKNPDPIQTRALWTG